MPSDNNTFKPLSVSFLFKHIFKLSDMTLGSKKGLLCRFAAFLPAQLLCLYQPVGYKSSPNVLISGANIIWLSLCQNIARRQQKAGSPPPISLHSAGYQQGWCFLQLHGQSLYSFARLLVTEYLVFFCSLLLVKCASVWRLEYHQLKYFWRKTLSLRAGLLYRYIWKVKFFLALAAVLFLAKIYSILR